MGVCHSAEKLELAHMRTKCHKSMSYFNFADLVYAHAFNP